jgi:PAS domain S-box-containing protein
VKALTFLSAAPLLALLTPVCRAAEPVSAASIVALTNAQQVIDLGVERARRLPHPVHLRGVVTYAVPGRNWIFVQDDTAGLLVVYTNRIAPMPFGLPVEVTGISGAGQFAAHCLNAQVRAMGMAAMPFVRRAQAEKLVAGEDFGRWVELEGRVRDLAVQPTELTLLISSERWQFHVIITLTNSMPLPLDWLDAKVRLRGVCWTETDRENKPSGFRIHCAGTNQITLLEPGRADVFAAPFVSPTELRRRTTNSDARIRVAGTVLMHAPGRRLYLQDELGPVRTRLLLPFLRGSSAITYVERPYLAPLEPGDRVEVIAAPAATAYTPLLVEAEYRKVGTGRPPVSVYRTVEQLASGRHSGELVTLRARLLDHNSRRDGADTEHELTLEAGKTIFQALISTSRSNSTDQLKPNSIVQVTGICSAGAGDWERFRSFRLLLRTAADVRVLGSAPFWTLWPVGRILSGAIGVCLIALGWIWLLRRRVSQRTAALAASEAHTRLIIDTALDAVVTMDRAGYVCGWSAQAEKIFGWKRSEAMGRTVAELIIPESYREAHTRGLKHLLATGQGTVVNRRIEISALRKDGKEFPVELSIVAMKSNGTWTFSAFARDISERKRTEEELRKALAQEQELSQLKSNFVNLVSHEFRTPLGIIMSAAENLENYLERLQPTERAELLADIRTSTQRMSGLMQEVLLLARVDAGKLPCKCVPLDLRAFLERLIEEVRGASDHACVIELNIAPDAVTARSDEALLRHTFTNLLSNAVKYSPLGQLVRFRVERDGDAAVFTVRDEGIGIPETDQKQLFQTFHRGSNVGERPGTGLGLVIVKRCVDLHGGTLQLESTVSVGTAVTVRLPLFAVSASADSDTGFKPTDSSPNNGPAHL